MNGMLESDLRLREILNKPSLGVAKRYRLTAAAINHGMTWSQMPEGEAFWKDIHDRLVKHADAKEKADKKGTELGLYGEVTRKIIDLSQHERQLLLSLLKAGTPEAPKVEEEDEETVVLKPVKLAKFLPPPPPPLEGEWKPAPLPYDAPGGVKGCGCSICKKAWGAHPKPGSYGGNPYKAEKPEAPLGTLTVDDIKEAKMFLMNKIPAYSFDPKTGETALLPKSPELVVGPPDKPDIILIDHEVPF